MTWLLWKKSGEYSVVRPNPIVPSADATAGTISRAAKRAAIAFFMVLLSLDEIARSRGGVRLRESGPGSFEVRSPVTRPHAARIVYQMARFPSIRRRAREGSIPG